MSKKKHSKKSGKYVPKAERSAAASAVKAEDKPTVEQTDVSADPEVFEYMREEIEAENAAFGAEAEYAEEYAEYQDYEEYDGKYAVAERILGVVTLCMAVLLLGGSLVFWWYFCRELTVCPAAIPTYQVYEALLIFSAAVPLIVSVGQFLLKKRVSAESWLINMCISGALTTVMVFIIQSSVHDIPFAWGDLPIMLCFAVSGCALPSAVYMAVRVAGEKLKQSIDRANSLDWAKVSNDVRVLCGHKSTAQKRK